MKWRAPVAAMAFAGLGATMLATGGTLFGALLVASAALTLAPSFGSRVVARAIAWATILPNAYVTVLLATAGHAPPLRVIAQIAVAAFGLVVAGPLLSTDRARAAFAPLAFRSAFLASAVGALASGITLGLVAQSFSHFSMLARDAFGLAVLAALLVAAGAGVVRMRAWGIALGVLASLASIPIVLWMRDSLITAPAVLATVPGALMGALVVAARARGARVPAEVPRVRVAAEDTQVRAISFTDPDDAIMESGENHARHARCIDARV